MVWFGKGSGKEVKNEILEQVWLDVETLWRGVRDQVSNQAGLQEIDELFQQRTSSSGRSDWMLLNRTEQRIAAFLPETKLHSEFALLMADAASKALPMLAFHEVSKQAYFSTPPVAGQPSANIELKRDAYLALLSDLQAFFIDRRFNRRLRRETAARLTWTGLILLLAVSAPFIAFYLMMQADSAGPAPKLFSHNPVFGIGMVAAFGLLGAYFSRLMGFQARLSAFGFDDVQTTFGGRLLFVRLVTGLIGALVFYFVLRSGFGIGGGP